MDSQFVTEIQHFHRLLTRPRLSCRGFVASSHYDRRSVWEEQGGPAKREPVTLLPSRSSPYTGEQ